MAEILAKSIPNRLKAKLQTVEQQDIANTQNKLLSHFQTSTLLHEPQNPESSPQQPSTATNSFTTTCQPQPSTTAPAPVLLLLHQILPIPNLFPTRTPSTRLLITCQIYPSTYTIKLTGKLLRRDDTFLTIQSSHLKKTLARALNYLNSVTSYGRYNLNFQTGTIEFLIAPAYSHTEFTRLMKQPSALLHILQKDTNQVLVKTLENNLFRILHLIGQLPESFEKVADYNNLTFRKLWDEKGRHLRYCSSVMAVMDEPDENTEYWEGDVGGVVDRVFREEAGKRVERGREREKEGRRDERVEEFLRGFGEVVRDRGIQEVRAEVQNSKKVVREFLKEARYKKANQYDQPSITNKILIKQSDLKQLSFTRIYQNDRSLIQRSRIPFYFRGTVLPSTPQKARQTKLLALKTHTSPSSQRKLLRQRDVVCYFQHFEHPCVAKYYLSDSFPKAILSDFYTYRGIDCYLQGSRTVVSEYTLLTILCKCASALRFLKNVGVGHLDVKINNFLLGRNFIPKITDFGEAFIPRKFLQRMTSADINKQIKPSTRNTPSSSQPTNLPAITELIPHMQRFRPGHTMPYTPPQIFTQLPQNNLTLEKADTYSFGIFMMELLFDFFVIRYRNCSQPEIEELYARKDYLSRVSFSVQRLALSLKSEIAWTVASVAVRCLNPEPKKRPCIDWVLVVLRVLIESINANTC